MSDCKSLPVLCFVYWQLFLMQRFCFLLFYLGRKLILSEKSSGNCIIDSFICVELESFLLDRIKAMFTGVEGKSLADVVVVLPYGRYSSSVYFNFWSWKSKYGAVTQCSAAVCLWHTLNQQTSLEN